MHLKVALLEPAQRRTLVLSICAASISFQSFEQLSLSFLAHLGGNVNLNHFGKYKKTYATFVLPFELSNNALETKVHLSDDVW